MASRLRLKGEHAWAAVATGFALLSLLTALAPGLDTTAWTWDAAQPLAATRWWTAALVHHGPWHLGANLGAAAAVAAWGWAARVRPIHAGAWLLAWPLSQALLITDPGSLSRYAGLSATLHAGVAIGCWHLLVNRTGGARVVGALVSTAVLIKLALEAPALQAWWAGVEVGQWPAAALPGAAGHVVAGHAHLCGVVAGLASAAATTLAAAASAGSGIIRTR